MCSIYVINIGANTNHRSQARSPIVNCNSFVFVSFCTERGEDNPTAYPKKMLPFINPHKQNLRTHNDPDWKNMTYGDICTGRGAALKHVNSNDILLFWGLLYHNECPDRRSCNDKKGACWESFSLLLDENKGWYLLGAMRVEQVVEGGEKLEELSPELRCRVNRNAHCCNGKVPTNRRVFLGDEQHSRLFDKAVALWVPRSNSQDEWESSLMYKKLRSADGQCLSLNCSPRWSSSLRACRKMWDLDKPKERKLAERVRDAIQKYNKDFDLLKDARY